MELWLVGAGHPGLCWCCSTCCHSHVVLEDCGKLAPVADVDAEAQQQMQGEQQVLAKVQGLAARPAPAGAGIMLGLHCVYAHGVHVLSDWLGWHLWQPEPLTLPTNGCG